MLEKYFLLRYLLIFFMVDSIHSPLSATIPTSTFSFLANNKNRLLIFTATSFFFGFSLGCIVMHLLKVDSKRNTSSMEIIESKNKNDSISISDVPDGEQIKQSKILYYNLLSLENFLRETKPDYSNSNVDNMLEKSQEIEHIKDKAKLLDCCSKMIDLDLKNEFKYEFTGKFFEFNGSVKSLTSERTYLFPKNQKIKIYTYNNKEYVNVSQVINTIRVYNKDCSDKMTTCNTELLVKGKENAYFLRKEKFFTVNNSQIDEAHLKVRLSMKIEKTMDKFNT